MCWLVLATFLLAPSSVARSAVPPELAAEPDEIVVIEKSRRLLTHALDQGDRPAAEELLAFLHQRINPARYRVFDSDETLLLGALFGHYDFLAHFQGEGLEEEDEEGPRCCRGWRDALPGALLARLPEARAAVRASSLSEADREFVDMLLTGFENRGGDRNARSALGARGEAYLARYPETPYRRWLLRKVVVRWRPFWSMSGNLYASWPFIDDQTTALYRKRSGPDVGAAFTMGFGEHLMVDLHFLFARTSPRTDLVIDGRTWPAGAKTQLVSWGGLIGYRHHFGRQSVEAAGGIGANTTSYQYGSDDKATAEFAQVAGIAALEYQFNLRNPSMDFAQGGVYGVLLCARAAIEKSLDERHGINPTVFMLQLGVALEGQFWQRVRE
jgi:hypothetical protein